jgi:hypothetical protein
MPEAHPQPGQGIGPLAGAARTTDRDEPEDNQDFVIALDLDDGCCAIILADGVGSWKQSGTAAQLAAEGAAKVLLAEGPSAIDAAFADASQAVTTIAPEEAGTTLVVVTVDEDGRVRCGYVGNGAVLEVTLPPGCEDVLWTNHLLPHVSYIDGREELGRAMLSTATDLPDVSQFTLQPRCSVSAILVFSDGIHTREQQCLAKTSDGRSWELLPEPLIEFLELAGACLSDDSDLHRSWLSAMLDDELGSLAARGLIDDDASVGMIVRRAPA